MTGRGNEARHHIAKKGMAMKKLILATVAGALMATASTAASAATYISAATFAAAHPGATTVTFTGITPDLVPLTSPYTKDGVTFSAAHLFATSGNFWGDHDALLDNAFNGYLTASFAPTTAVGFYFASDYYAGTPIAITLLNGATQVYSGTVTGGGTYSGFSFFGIDGVGTFDQLKIDAAGTDGFASLGPISFSSGVGAVPEPATWALMILGFGAAGVALRRKAKGQAAYA
jgi:hypothetical protein